MEVQAINLLEIIVIRFSETVPTPIITSEMR